MSERGRFWSDSNIGKLRDLALSLTEWTVVGMTQQAGRETQHDAVYGSSFALYDRSALLEFLEPFRVRFQANGLQPRSYFEGRRCLDAGCGNGRGSLFMLENGAAHVTAVDISEQNIRSTAKNLADFGYANVACRQSTLESLPFESGSFDFVWCNGVIMHTAHPDKCIAELARVLKPGGGLWIYVYGAGGIYWHFVQQFRALLADVSVERLIAALQLLNYPVRFIAEYVDDWKTPFLRAYSDATMQAKLRQLGFEDAQRVVKGMPYDTCARIAQYPAERQFLGEGDLRYLAIRGHGPSTSGVSLDADHIDDPGAADPVAARLFGVRLAEFRQLASGRSIEGIAACARIQRYLREHVMSTAAGIDVAAMGKHLDETVAILRSLAAP